MSTAELADELSQLKSSQKLHFIKLSNSIRPKDSRIKGECSPEKSEGSADIEDVTPAHLEAELAHYKELFSKLRFSYVEQLTKENFLRKLTSPEPPFIEGQENQELEARLVQTKAELKAQKVEIAELIAELDRTGRELSQTFQSIQSRSEQLRTLPLELQSLEASIEELQELQAANPQNPSLSLPLPETLSLVSSREAELASLNSQLAILEASVPRKSRELERLEKELHPLELQKQASVSAAKEARRRKQEGVSGIGDELEESGRWLRAVESGLTSMVKVEV